MSMNKCHRLLYCQMAQLITYWTYWNTGDPGLNPSWILVFFHHTLQYMRLRQL